MNYFNTASKGIKIFEKALMIIVLVSIGFQYTVNYNSTIDLVVASFLLCFLYCPFGFYFMGKPVIPSILFGLIYALGMCVLLLGMLKVHNYQYPLVIVLLMLLGIGIFLYAKLKSGAYTPEYVYANFFRIIFIVLLNLVVLIFRF
jgi:hypothetical protein